MWFIVKDRQVEWNRNHRLVFLGDYRLAQLLDLEIAVPFGKFEDGAL